jgi:sugar lactone lactonase YvrE
MQYQTFNELSGISLLKKAIMSNNTLTTGFSSKWKRILIVISSVILSFFIYSFMTVQIPILKSEMLLNLNSKLGEGALWNHQTNTFWWVDIESGLFHIYDPASKKNTTWPVHQRIGTVVPDKGGNAIVALQDGIYRLQLNNGSLELLAQAPYDPVKFRFNDGKCDPMGRLWVGTMALDGSRETAALYRMNHDYNLVKVLDGITISNGIVWSADGRTMYYIDTPTQQIKEFAFDPSTGNIRFTRVAVQIQRELGSPDGMAIDEKGNLWVGHWGGNAVYCWDPRSGDLITKVDVEAKNVTACAFTGPELDQLIITTASIGMSEEERKQLPLSGSLFKALPGIKGSRIHFFGK